MKNLFFTLALAFVSLSFTSEKIEPKSNDLEKFDENIVVKHINEEGITASIIVYPCEDAGGVAYVTISVDCEGDGIVDYSFSGYMCADYANGLFEQFVSSCGSHQL